MHIGGHITLLMILRVTLQLLQIEVGWLLLLMEYPSYTNWRIKADSLRPTCLPPGPDFLQQALHTLALFSSWFNARLLWVLVRAICNHIIQIAINKLISPII